MTTYKEYFDALNFLAGKLKETSEAKPYDPDAYNKVVDQLNALSDAKYRRRRRRPWFAIGAILCLIWIFAWLVFEIVRGFYI